MASFTDKNGRQWQIVFTIGLVKRIKEVKRVDLLDFDLQIYAELLADPITFVDVLWLTIEDQAKAAEITDEAFAYCLDADAIESAAEALIEALIAFFPRPRRPALEALWKKVKRACDQAGMIAANKVNTDKTDQVVARGLANMEADLDRAMDEAIARVMPGTPSGDSPVS